MKDTLGDRIKENYENRTRTFLPRRTNTIIRVDGKAFHTYTRGCEKPFDVRLMHDMNCVAVQLCKQIQGAKLAYVQSDEISILLTDYDGLQTDAWFDGNIQKITSVAASIATAEFAKCRLSRMFEDIKVVDDTEDFMENVVFPNFDARVFTIPELAEVANYFLWRCQDASRNSVQMLARSLYSHKELEGKNNSELHELIFKKGSNWNDLEDGKKRGRVVLRGPLGWVCHGAGGHEFAYWSSVVNRSVDMGKTEVEHSDWMKNQKKYIGEMMEWMKKHEEFLSTLSPEDLAKEKQKIRC